MRILAILFLLSLTSCGAGYNPGCSGKEGASEYCRYHKP